MAYGKTDNCGMKVAETKSNSGADCAKQERKRGNENAAKSLKAKDELVYCRTDNPKVAGSNPAPATTYKTWGRKGANRLLICPIFIE